jgi:uncharacterized protein DUF3311
VLRKHAGLLLLVPIIACLLPWTFNRRTPTLAGIPFFYWFQLALVPMASVFALLVIVLGDDSRKGGGRR